ncbi:unnamed protein product [Orchesella dallaii]|uniref:Uncharacterized protein n=1 Tax=Orchesella dallaii TaxID=48710 RepID=A0ABP1R7Z3_9HEXA
MINISYLLSYSCISVDDYFPGPVVISSTNGSLREGPYRFSHQTNVILSPLAVDDLNSNTCVSQAIEKFMFSIIPEISLFMFININNKAKARKIDTDVVEWFDNQSVFPAMKIVVNIPCSICNLSETEIRVICNGYCKGQITSLHRFSMFHQSLLKTHRNLFRNANRKLIPSMADDMFINFKKYVDPKRCLKREEFLRSSCRTEKMSVLILNEVHNITLNLSRSTGDALMKYKVTNVHTPIEHIVFAVHFQAPGLPRPFAQQLYFNRYDTTSLLYCEKQKKVGISVHVQVWYEPFSPGLWFGFLSVLCFVAILLKLEFKLNGSSFEMLKLFSLVFGQGGLERKRYFIIACGITFLCLLYENSLLSLITVVPQPKSFETLRNLLDAGFKIMWPANMPPSHSPRVLYGLDFNMSGLHN